MLPRSSSLTIITTLSAASGPGLRASFISQASAPTVASAPRRTKVSNPLTLERPIGGGLRGGGVGGGDGSPSAGLGARPNRLTRGRGASPSPGSWSALISPAASFALARRSCRPTPPGGEPGRGAGPNSSRPGAAGKHRIAFGPPLSVQRAKDERSVGAAEAERIGQRRLDRPLARAVR